MKQIARENTLKGSVLVLGTNPINYQEEETICRDRNKNHLFAGISATHLQVI